MGLFGVLWLVVLSVGLSDCFQCPSPCRCFPNFDAARTITVDCRGQDLFEIPFPIPPETSSLDVSNNLIQFVRGIDFSDGLDNLRFLQLQNNELMDIEPGALSKLPNLEVLRLTNNRVRRLRNGTFNGLSNLHTLEAYNLGLESFEQGLFDPLTNLVLLDLSYNNLQAIPSGTFFGHQRLQRLLLSDNFLTTIQQGAIDNLPSLTTINLAFNQLQALDPNSISRVNNIRSLSLQGNPIECGCNAVWLFDFLVANDLNGPDCVQPEQFRELPLLSLTMEQFCDLPTATITSPPVVIATGKSLQLDCVTTGAPPPQVQWSRNGMTFDPADTRVSIVDMTLMISDVNETDSGIYHCIATSSAGQVSTSVAVTVLNIDLNTTETAVVRRDNVLLDCVDMTDINSPLVWTFNSTKLELSDKYTVIDNGSLFIRDVGLEDMGLYTCEVGELQLMHALLVSAAPDFVIFPEGSCETPQLLMIDSDQELAFVCAVFGIPPPTVTWLYEGDRLNQTVPPGQMIGGLVDVTFSLIRPSVELSGSYTCMASSSLGTISRTAMIDIRFVLQTGTNPTLDAIHFVGDTAVLECEPEERIDPGSDITWRTRSGLSLPLERVVYACNNATLIIKDVNLNDRDGYECIVQTPDGPRSRVTHDLILNEPPTIEKVCSVPVVTAVARTNVSLPCITRGTPDPSYRWTVNGSTIASSNIANRSTIEIIGQELNRNFGVRLNITSVLEGDNGLYTCMAFSTINGGTFNDSYTVELQIQRLPYFTYQPTSSAVIRGMTATLLCGGRGSPNPSVTWMFRRGNSSGETIVTPDLRHIITSHALLIQDVRPGDEGTYFCNISSPLQTRTSSEAYLRVYIPPQLAPLVFDVTVPVGTPNVTMDCFGSGDPSPVVHWLRGDTVLPITGEQVILPNGSLVLLSIEPSDRGTYTCRLANVAGMVYHNVTLNVQTLPDTLVEPSMVTANVGCQVTLRCTDGGRLVDDPSEMLWSCEGQAVEEREGLDILRTGELVLTNLDLLDSCNYSCTLWSELGFTEDTALVVVEDPIFASGAPVAPPTLTTITPLTQILPLLGTAQFVCFVEGFPPPEIVWLRNGLPQPNFRRVDIHNGGLVIRELRITDNATYTCEATNVLGKASINFTLSISAAPTFDLRPLTQTVLLGGIVSLMCSASGNPPPDIMWLHNGLMVMSDPTGRVFINPLTQTLSVIQVTSVDSGTYTCLTKNSAGTAEIAVPVFVEDVMIPPNITVPPESVSTFSGLPVILDCIAFGLPTPTLSWSKDDVPLEPCPSDPVCVVNGSVVIETASEDDTGRYSCLAENTAGTAVYEAFVTVETETCSRAIPVFNIYPSPKWLSNGSLLQLDCQATGTPIPTISWLLNFDPINVTANNCTDMTSDLMVCSNGSLIIREVDFVDEGFYTCVADNGQGVNQVSVSVDVGVASTENVAGPLSRPLLTDTPIIELQLTVGVNITLNCSAEGNPPPTITWLREGVAIDFNTVTNQIMLPNGSLVLSSVSDADGGEYTCRAENSEGTAEVTFLLDFNQLRRLATGNEKPVIVEAPRNHDVMMGSKVTMSCIAKGRPDPLIFWKHDNKQVYSTRQMYLNANGSLIIPSAQPHHSGNYTCMATNDQGSTHSQVQLNVNLREVPPMFVETPTDQLVTLGGFVVMGCTAVAMGDKAVILRWYREGLPVTGYHGHQVLCGGETLLVNEIQEIGSFEYSCVASSVHGNSTSYATLTVTKSPVDKTVYSKLGDPVTLMCGNGVWTRNGQSLKSTPKQFLSVGFLIIYQSTLLDEGEYLCTSLSSTVNHYLHITTPPEIADSTALTKAHPGASVTLHCLATGIPRPIVSWYRALSELVTNSNHSVLSDGSLVLYSVSVSDGGVYSCVARNVAGETKNTAVLIVE